MKNHLLEQFDATFDKKNWFVSLRDAVRDLTDQQARQKIQPNLNSSYELVTHLIFWNERYLYKVRGQQLPEVHNNEETFHSENQLHFDELMAKADRVFSEWQEELNKGLPTDAKTDWISTVGHINLHNAYHIGQIVILRKLQGNWDKANGVS